MQPTVRILGTLRDADNCLLAAEYKQEENAHMRLGIADSESNSREIP